MLSEGGNQNALTARVALCYTARRTRLGALCSRSHAERAERACSTNPLEQTSVLCCRTERTVNYLHGHARARCFYYVERTRTHPPVLFLLILPCACLRCTLESQPSPAITRGLLPRTFTRTTQVTTSQNPKAKDGAVSTEAVASAPPLRPASAAPNKLRCAHELLLLARKRSRSCRSRQSKPG